MPNARTTDPQTSHDAAASVNNLSQTKQWIIGALTLKSMSDEKLFEYHNAYDRMGDAIYVSPSGLRSRRAELVAAGLVIDSGERTKMRSGRQAIVWAVA
jgi:hypothetical protein